jgi:t-SNARE complex subunit (syntaxin)
MSNPAPFGEGPDAAKARKRRSLMIALSLIAFIVLVFVVTIVRLGGNIADRPL